MTRERDEIVKTIVRETLAERFTDDEFVFDPIQVVPVVDEFGDGDGKEYLRIVIVFAGDQKLLDPAWTSGFIRRIEPKLIETGIEEFPSPSFVEKSEWSRLCRKWQREPVRRAAQGGNRRGCRSDEHIESKGESSMSRTIFERAEEFIWNDARLLERQRFAYHFKGGSREAVIAALRAYQNADGGFGHALEPDIRCPQSQPVPVQHALEFLDDIGFDAQMVQRACDYLMTITTPEGGVPWLLPSAHQYPRASWWNAVDDLPASLNPTAAIAGVLHKNQVQHPWMAPATAYCWAQIDNLQAEEMHEMGAVLAFLYYAPDRERAERELGRLVDAMFATGLVADARAAGYVRKPLNWAPTPDHPLRKHFREADIAANLDALIADQQADGGWPITWQAVSQSCELEWRGWVTLGALLTLRANGRYSPSPVTGEMGF